MNKTKLFKLSLIILTVLIVSTIGYAAWRVNKDIEEITIQTYEYVIRKAEIDTSDWEIYRNEEYGFEVKYPKGWHSGQSKTGVVFLQPEQGDADLPGIWIYILDNPFNLSREEYWFCESKKYDAPYIVKESITVNGIEGLKVENLQRIEETHIILSHNSKIYEILRIGLNNEIFGGIVLTFKWL